MTANIFRLQPPNPDQFHPSTKDLMLFLVCLRRDIRRTVQALANQRDAARLYRRQAKKLEANQGPFDAARIASLVRLANASDSAGEVLMKALKDNGQLLIELASFFDAATTLDLRCDVLGVNISDRDGLSQGDGLLRIVSALGLEESASQRCGEWKSGPLRQAVEPVVADFLQNTPEGRELRDSLVAPICASTRPPRLRLVVVCKEGGAQA